MNAKDRKQLAEIRGTLEQAHADLEQLQSAEQDKFDNMSEGLQQGERGQAIEQAANELQEAVDNLQQAIDNLTNMESA